MTTVFPDPVAILKAMRNRMGLASWLNWRSSLSIHVFPVFLAISFRYNRCFQGLNLTEEKFAVTIQDFSNIQASKGSLGYTRITNITPLLAAI